MQAAPSHLSQVELRGGLGESSPASHFRIATACGNLPTWLRFEFLSWAHRAAWVPVWGAKGIYLRTVMPLDHATAYEHHRAWHEHITAKNTDLDLASELTLQLAYLRSVVGAPQCNISSTSTKK